MTKQLLIILCSVFAFTITFFAQNKKDNDNIEKDIISIQNSLDTVAEGDIPELEFNREEDNQMRIDKYLEDIEYYYKQKKYTDVINIALEVLALDSTNVDAHLRCCLASIYTNQYQQALRLFDKVVELYPAPTTYGNRGSLKGELGYDSIAIVDLNKALELNPEYAYAYNNRGGVYADLEENDKALDDLNMAIEFKPELPNSYVNRGDVYFNMGEFQQALDEYNTGIDYMFPDLGIALYKKGLTFSKLQQPQEAKEAFEQAIKAYTEALQENAYDYQSVLNRGEVYELLANYELALPDYQLALTKYQGLVEQNPKSPTMIYFRARAYKGLKQYDKALTDLQQVVQLRPLYKEAERDIKEIQELMEKLP